LIGHALNGVGSRPIDLPAAARQLPPEEFFHGSAARVVVEQASSFIKPPRMRRSDETELLAIEVVAELVA
jgi:hypothetical protein